MRKLRKTLVLIVFIGALIFGAFIVQKVISDLSVADSSALYGGELEKGYPSAGFLINYNFEGGLSYCGYTAINNRIAVTAAHCADSNTKEMYMGKQEFDLDLSNLLKVDSVIQKEGWINGKKRIDDFMVLRFNDTTGFFQDFSEIASPVEGCFYRVVAYGRTENPGEPPQRKSAKMCAFEITDTTFRLKGEKSGICFGDSGSPIFYDGTNKIVGNVASIINEVPGADPCDFGNTAIIVRTDANARLINENNQASDPDAADIVVTDGVLIEVADNTLLESIGLGKLERLDERERYTYALYGIGALMVIMIIIIWVNLLKPRRDY